MRIKEQVKVTKTVYDGIQIEGTGLIAVRQITTMDERVMEHKEYIVSEDAIESIQKADDINTIWKPVDDSCEGIVPIRLVKNKKKFLEMLKTQSWPDINDLVCAKKQSPFCENPYEYFTTHSYNNKTKMFVFWNGYNHGVYEYDIATRTFKRLSIARVMTYIESNISFDFKEEAEEFAKRVLALPNCTPYHDKKEREKYLCDDTVERIPYYNVTDGEYTVRPFYFYAPQHIFDKYSTTKCGVCFMEHNMFKDYLAENGIEYPVYVQ